MKKVRKDNINNNLNNSSYKKSKLSDKGKQQKKIFLLFVAIAVLVIVILVNVISAVVKLINNPSNTLIIKNGVVSKDETDIGYIIRDETVVKGENYKNGMEPIIEEGKKAAKGEEIFRYYSSGEDSLKAQIADLDKKIEEAMKDEKNLFPTDVKLLDSKIEEELISINKLNDAQEIQEKKKKINEYISKKAEIAGETSAAGSYLKSLVDERKKYQDELNSNSEYVYSPSSGIISYRVDGLENTLNTNDLSKYNKEFLDNLNLKTGQIISASTEQGKVVNNFKCYIAFTSKSDEAKNAKVGDKVEIVLPSSKVVDATVNTITNESDDEVTIILEFTEGIDETLSYRKISFDVIWWEASGYKVPNSAIIQENNLNYVIRTRNGYSDKVLVKIYKKTDEYSIIRNYSLTELKELNYDKNAKTSILLYDEILLNPTESELNSTK